MDCILRVTCQQTSYQNKMDCSLHVICQQTSYQSKTWVIHRLQSMSYSGMMFVDKLHAYYNPCLTPV
jgi:hypothetical protein